MSRIDEILCFWFGEVRDGCAYSEERARIWFAQNPQFDQEITDRFSTDYELAAQRKLADWQETPQGGLALVLLLDQFPRNMFRGHPRAFATDALARDTADLLIQKGFDRQLPPVQRQFLYLPFMHSEDRAHQHRSVALFSALQQECEYLDSLSYAIKHRDVIERFGRFPHRNAIIGRTSTPEEIEFLTQPEASF
jgi:uncharacterized protein (DUF924 family)